MDQSIKPGTSREKFEVMKQRLISKGRWNLVTEKALREVLEQEEEIQVAETVDTPSDAKSDQPTKPRSKRKVRTEVVEVERK